LSLNKKWAAVCSLTVAAILGAGFGSTAAHAATGSGAACSGANLCPPNTAVTANLKTGTDLNIAVQAASFGPISMTCTTFAASFGTPASGLKTTLTAPPTVSGCSDDLGATVDFIMSGKWAFRWNTTGTKVKITAPINGGTIVDTVLPGCVITLNPTAGSNMTGAYNETRGIARFTNQNFGVIQPNASCPAGTWTFTMSFTLKFSPIVKVG